MKPFRIVAMSGAAGSGKDTAASYLAQSRGYATYAFARPLKAALNAMLGWKMEQWDNREWKEGVLPDIGKSPRQMAQTLGTEWGRNLVNQDLWLLLGARAAAAARCNGLNGIVFTDCRFDNEAKFIRDMGGLVIQLVRPSAAAVNAHASEKPVSPEYINVVLRNDGSIERLASMLDTYLNYTWEDSL